MKVYFDVTCLMPERVSGIGVYARELFSALKLQLATVKPVYKLSRVLKPSSIEKHIGASGKPFLGFLESFSDASIMHGPDFRLLSYSSRFKKIVTIHDLAVFHDGFNSESFRLSGQKATREVINKGNPDIIVADTQVIADEIRDYFPEFRERVRYIPAGCDHFLKNQNGFERKTQKAPYFLYAGHLEARKNILGIVKGFERVAQSYPEARLLLVGKDGFRSDEIRAYIQSSSAKRSIELKGFVSYDELQTLYASATAFLFPSFYEGFGFPVLEAMSLGCPVITSNYGAMSELAGSAALLVDPKSPEEIGAAMVKLLEDSSVVAQLMESGGERWKQYTWERCASQFIDLYKNL